MADAAAPLSFERLEAHFERSPVSFSHLTRVVFPATADHAALLKAHLLDYYIQVAPYLLPHLADRPLAVRRYPDGIDGEAFFQKDWTGTALPPVVETVEISSDSRGLPLRWVTVGSELGLGWMVQMGAVEAHPWLARIGPDRAACATPWGLRSRECGLNRPDLLLIDLDPYARPDLAGRKSAEAGGDPGIHPQDWASAVEAALVIRDALRSLGMTPFVKTSGKRGLHVLIPLKPLQTFTETRAVARRLAAHLVALHPDLLSLEKQPTRRAGKVVIDVDQNGRGRTLAAPYSLRPTAQATVSMPLAWDDLEQVSPERFTLLTVPELLKERRDPWLGFEGARRDLRSLLTTPRDSEEGAEPV